MLITPQLVTLTLRRLWHAGSIPTAPKMCSVVVPLWKGSGTPVLLPLHVRGRGGGGGGLKGRSQR